LQVWVNDATINPFGPMAINTAPRDLAWHLAIPLRARVQKRHAFLPLILGQVRHAPRVVRPGHGNIDIVEKNLSSPAFSRLDPQIRRTQPHWHVTQSADIEKYVRMCLAKGRKAWGKPEFGPVAIRDNVNVTCPAKVQFVTCTLQCFEGQTQVGQCGRESRLVPGQMAHA
jgi:hypothetical protein